MLCLGFRMATGCNRDDVRMIRLIMIGILEYIIVVMMMRMTIIVIIIIQ